MKNKEKYNLSHLVERPGKTILDYCFRYVEIEYGGRIIKEYRCLDIEVSKKFFEWLEEDDGKECKPTILTEKEKAYLSAVIKPFRKDVEWIERMDNSFVNGNQHQFLCISLTNDYCCLPLFKKDTMYKGMEVNKRYTLEELGI